jgi:chaperonin GroES
VESDEEKTRGGVIIPDTAQEKPIQGLVLVVGTGAPTDSGALRPIDLKEGDRVLFGQSSGTEVIIDGEERLILKESEILGVIEGNVQVSAKQSS